MGGSRWYVGAWATAMITFAVLAWLWSIPSLQLTSWLLFGSIGVAITGVCGFSFFVKKAEK